MKWFFAEIHDVNDQEELRRRFVVVTPSANRDYEFVLFQEEIPGLRSTHDFRGVPCVAVSRKVMPHTPYILEVEVQYAHAKSEAAA